MPISRDEEVELGRSARQRVPRRTFGEWAPTNDRADPVEILVRQDALRAQGLVPIRHGRMSASAFTFYRGAAAVMAADLAPLPRSGLEVQLCGDAHLSNLGVFGSPSRELLFDLNDFDETLRGPFEWDVLRLAASFEIATRSVGFGRSTRTAITATVVQAYREAIADFSAMGPLAVWYSRLDAEVWAETANQPAAAARRVKATLEGARKRTSLQAVKKLTKEVDGRLQFVNDPPLLVPLTTIADEIGGVDRVREAIRATYLEYRSSLPDAHCHLLTHYEVTDVAHKVVGVGSVGLRAYIVLLQGRNDRDPLVLQVKEAGRSVLEDHLAESPYAHHGRRVVEGQRMMQAASDIFLGWSTSEGDGRQYYWRQLRDMKASAEVETMKPQGLTSYAKMCGWSLARAHARSGSPIALAAYLGTSDSFDRSVAEFATRYADQTELDHLAHLAAITDGRVTSTPNL
ncbi:MAG: hypothetical protein RLZZ623_2112 [Actinomycetota bacterium]|jgi:uncharacterized protein (DUF2252 family)